jgi:hypothetical protein
MRVEKGLLEKVNSTCIEGKSISEEGKGVGLSLVPASEEAQ